MSYSYIGLVLDIRLLY